MYSERLGKERRLQSLETGDVVIHPFKQERFKFRRVKRRYGSHHYLNIVLQGSDLEIEFSNSSKDYIQWMTNEDCQHPRCKSQGSKCSCMKMSNKINVESLSNQQSTYFTQDNYCREARVFEWLKAAWVMRESREIKFKDDTRTYKVDNQSRWYGKSFLILNEIFILPGGINKCTSHFVCLNALLSFYNIYYQRLTTLEDIIKSGKTIGPTHLLVGSKSNGAIKGLIGEKLHDNVFSLQLHHIELHATKGCSENDWYCFEK